MAETKVAETVTPDQAYQTLLNEVHHPVFFTKLAQDYGVVPETEEDAYALVDMAYKLRLLNQAQSKQAKTKASKIKRASSDLDNVLKQYYGASIPSTVDQEIRQAAVTALQNPTLKQAAQVFGVAIQQNS